MLNWYLFGMLSWYLCGMLNWYLLGNKLLLVGNAILRKTIEGYLDSVPSLTFNTIKTLLIMHAFHISRHLQSKWMLYFSHVSMVQVQY